MKQLERMLQGKLYSATLYDDEDLIKLNEKKFKFLDEFNSTSYSDYKTREKLLRKYFGKVGKNAIINKPFHCDYGANIFIGDNFYANFNCTMLDCAKITIGDNVFFAPNVSLFTAAHPIDKDVRNSTAEYAKEIHIGNDVWIGGNTVINPGVTIHDNVVIGSGSVVTKDTPTGVIAVGNPCHVLRKIDDKDKEYWTKLLDEFLSDCGKHR